MAQVMIFEQRKEKQFLKLSLIKGKFDINLALWLFLCKCIENISLTKYQ